MTVKRGPLSWKTDMTPGQLKHFQRIGLDNLQSQAKYLAALGVPIEAIRYALAEALRSES